MVEFFVECSMALGGGGVGGCSIFNCKYLHLCNFKVDGQAWARVTLATGIHVPVD